MSRATIKLTANNTVELRGTDPETDEPVHREFWIPRGGGYVREGDGQVCEMLSTRGSTLMAEDGGHLLTVIRREWKRRREFQKRQAERDFA